jgi:hypothetical protein
VPGSVATAERSGLELQNQGQSHREVEESIWADRIIKHQVESMANRQGLAVEGARGGGGRMEGRNGFRAMERQFYRRRGWTVGSRPTCQQLADGG